MIRASWLVTSCALSARPSTRTSPLTPRACQLSRKAIESSDDYLHLFFASVERQASEGDGEPSFYEAHWSASAGLEDHQISYTSSDALIDDYFATHPESLPASLTVRELERLAESASLPERQALALMADSLSADTQVSLRDMVAVNHDTQRRLEGHRESSSSERNAIANLPYKLMLSQLARRLVYQSLNIEDSAFSDVTDCEAQTPTGFLASGGN